MSISRPSSIQSKVRTAFYICISLIIIVSILNYLNLLRLQRKTEFGFIISDFFDATLEMRRYEKNYFLYHDLHAYEENIRFTETAEKILAKNRDAIRKLAASTDVAALEEIISEYKVLMEGYHRLDKEALPMEAFNLENRLREHGKRLVTATEAISAAEREYIRSLIARSRRILVVSIIGLVFAGWLVGRYLSHMVVRPLKQLEESMKRVSVGQFEGVSFVSADREIVSLEGAFRRMVKELELRQMRIIAQSEKLACLGTMVSGVAHQLNNPLSNVSSSCQILQEEFDSPDISYKRELMGQIESEVDRARAMVQSLLEFSRLKEFKSKPIQLKSLVDETLRLLQGNIPPRVEIEVDIPETAWIIADKQRIEQVILNLVKNSIDAIPDEGRIYISARDNDDDKTVGIRIRDTGLGMEPEVIEKIFDPFFTTKEEGKGSGLGLFVAREIVQEHEGDISVESVVGSGTCFTVRLPRKESICNEEARIS